MRSTEDATLCPHKEGFGILILGSDMERQLHLQAVWF